MRSCIHIFKYDDGAQSIATVPLDTFTEGGRSSGSYPNFCLLSPELHIRMIGSVRSEFFL